MLAAVAFILLGVVMIFGPEGWNSPARSGMAIMCWAIAGVQLNQVPSCYPWGVLLFGIGFIAAGLLILTEAWVVLQSGQDNAALTATKWAIFSSVLLIGGGPVLIGFIRGKGKTPVYEEGLGPHGLVSWQAAESVELVGADSSHPELHVGAYNGWTLSIRVPTEQIDSVSSFVSRLHDGSDHTQSKVVYHKSSFEEAVADGISLKTFVNIGIALNEQGRHEQAIASYDRALEVDPDCIEAWANKGKALNDLSRHQEALECYQRVLNLDPDNAESWSDKGVTLRAIGQIQEALSATTALSTSIPNSIQLGPIRAICSMQI